jgi:class 3 adenylate cyclase
MLVRVGQTTDRGIIGEAEPRRTRRIVTVLRANPARSPESLDQDPEITETFERRVMDTVRRAVERHGGTIDRTDYDGVTGVFGLVVAREDDALRAIWAAAELIGDASTGEPVTFRVGIATGEVLTGSSDGRGSSVTGAPIHAASRLAVQAARREVLLALETERLVRDVTSTEKVNPAAGTSSGSPALRLIAITDGQLNGRDPTTPFVGRIAELEALLLAFGQVSSEGRPGVATVIGPAGIGKSRLVAEFFARISARATILRSRCLPYGDGITFWPVRELAAGRHYEVERYAFWGRDIAQPHDSDAHAQWRIAISGLRSEQGRHDEAVVLAREAVALVAPTEDVVMRMRAQRTLAGVLRAAGDEPAAVVAALEARSLAAAKQDRATLRKVDAFLMG